MRSLRESITDDIHDQLYARQSYLEIEDDEAFEVADKVLFQLNDFDREDAENAIVNQYFTLLHKTRDVLVAQLLEKLYEFYKEKDLFATHSTCLKTRDVRNKEDFKERFLNFILTHQAQIKEKFKDIAPENMKK